MPEIFKIKQSDTGASFEAILQKNGTAINLTGAAVEFRIRRKGERFAAAATIVDAATGSVAFGNPLPAGFPKTIGRYEQEWEVTFSGGSTLTIPSQAYNMIEILDAI